MAVTQPHGGFDLQKCHSLIGEVEAQGTKDEGQPQTGFDRLSQFDPESEANRRT